MPNPVSALKKLTSRTFDIDVPPIKRLRHEESLRALTFDIGFSGLPLPSLVMFDDNTVDGIAEIARVADDIPSAWVSSTNSPEEIIARTTIEESGTVTLAEVESQGFTVAEGAAVLIGSRSSGIWSGRIAEKLPNRRVRIIKDDDPDNPTFVMDTDVIYPAPGTRLIPAEVD